MDDELLRVAEAARLLYIHPQTLREWTDHGVIAAVRTAGGHRRYRRGDVEQLIADLRASSAARVGESGGD